MTIKQIAVRVSPTLLEALKVAIVYWVRVSAWIPSVGIDETEALLMSGRDYVLTIQQTVICKFVKVIVSMTRIEFKQRVAKGRTYYEIHRSDISSLGIEFEESTYAGSHAMFIDGAVTGQECLVHNRWVDCVLPDDEIRELSLYAKR